jgi:hypothetical protein
MQKGENCLHIAIVNQNLTLVKALVTARPDQMEQHATGEFFAPGKPCYYGELPLSFAASTSQIEMVDFLLDSGADITDKDICNGNNCLHMAVLCGNIKMFDHLMARWEESKHRYSNRCFDSTFDCGFAGAHLLSRDEALATPYSEIPLWRHLNLKGQSCLTLAASVGTPEMFKHILDSTKKLLWVYGPVTCVCYPLAGLDTPLNSSSISKKNSNKIITEESNPKNIDVNRFKILRSASTDDQVAINCVRIDRYDSKKSQIEFQDIKKVLLQTAVEKSAIMEIVDHNRLELIGLKRVDDLVWRKWDAFAFRIYLYRLMHTLVLIAALFIATTLPRWEPIDWSGNHTTNNTNVAVADDSSDSSGSTNETTAYVYNYSYSALYNMTTSYDNRNKVLRSLLELLVVLATCRKFKIEYYEIKDEGFFYHFTRSGAAVFENISSASFIIVIFSVFISRLSDGQYGISSANENAALAMATLAAWVNILWFLLGWRSTGPFVIMLQKMVVSDMRTFCIISTVFVGAFASSFNLLRHNTVPNAQDGDIFSSFSHDGFLSRVEELICAMLGKFLNGLVVSLFFYEGVTLFEYTENFVW